MRPRNTLPAPAWLALGALLSVFVRWPSGRKLSGRARRILEFVSENPGCNLSQIRLAVPMAWGTLYHHLDRLASAGFVKSLRHRRSLLVFPPHAAVAPPTRDPGPAALASRGGRALAGLILENPRLTIPELADRLGITPRMVYVHLRRFEECGYIVLASPRQFRGFRTTERLAVALRHLSQTP